VSSAKPDPTTVRVDRWLFAVRLFKTRSAAGTACSTGRVMINDEAAKPAQKVGIGDRVDVKRRDFTANYVVQRLIEKRVGAPVAVECYNDLTPERPEKSAPDIPFYAVRERGAGRPTKRERRELDRLRRRD